MKCVKCGARKGKRACPALKGDICPQCCGEHRLKTIECPPDCAWLGGLAAVLAPSSLPTEEVVAAMRDAHAELAQWINANASKVPFAVALMGQVFEGKAPEEGDDWLAGMVFAAMCSCAADEQGKRAVDHFIAERARDLKPSWVAAAKAMSRASVRPVKVESVEDGRVLLRDLLDDRVLRLREVDTSAVKVGEVIAMVLVPVGEDHVSLADSFIPADAVEPMLAELREVAGDLTLRFLVKLRKAGPVYVEA
jgi:hypothetical protein